MEVSVNNSELDAKLRNARKLSLPADYVEAFPETVLRNLRSSTWKPASQVQRSWRPAPVLAMAISACIVIAFALGFWRGQAGKDPDVLADVKFIQETMAMFPNQVRAIVKDRRGVNLVLADRPAVPVSTPIYVRIREGQLYTSLVTFSGQEIEIAGQKVTVLSGADGGIILVGNQFVWLNKKPAYAGKNLEIEARNLNLAAM